MKRTLTFLVIAASAFLIGIALTKTYYRWNIQFYSRGVGSFGMCEESFGGFNSYDSCDGERLMSSKIQFTSESSARECFENTLRSNELTVLSREDLFDKSGVNVVGERIIGKNDLDGPDSGFVFSLDEDWIFEFRSTSLRHALIFEKQTRKY